MTGKEVTKKAGEETDYEFETYKEPSSFLCQICYNSLKCKNDCKAFKYLTKCVGD